MREYETRTVEQKLLVSVTCDCCSMETDDVLEMQEFLHVSFVGGYGSIFGDGSYVQGDFCQRCVKELLGNYLKTE